MSETLPPQVEADTDEITLLPSATRGMRREDINLASLSLPFVGTPPPHFGYCVRAAGRSTRYGRRGHRTYSHDQP